MGIIFRYKRMEQRTGMFVGLNKGFISLNPQSQTPRSAQTSLNARVDFTPALETSARSSLRSVDLPPLSARWSSSSRPELSPRRREPSNTPAESSDLRNVLTPSAIRLMPSSWLRLRLARSEYSIIFEAVPN